MSGLLERVERLAIGLTAAFTLVAAFVPGGGLWAAAGVMGGAALGAVSYWAIKYGVTGIADAILREGPTDGSTPKHPGESAARTPGRRRRPRGFVMFVVRYALLALLAYVMIARLRLPPIWLLCGASVMAIATAIALLRGIRRI